MWKFCDSYKVIEGRRRNTAFGWCWRIIWRNVSERIAFWKLIEDDFAGQFDRGKLNFRRLTEPSPQFHYKNLLFLWDPRFRRPSDPQICVEPVFLAFVACHRRETVIKMWRLNRSVLLTTLTIVCNDLERSVFYLYSVCALEISLTEHNFSEAKHCATQ